MLILKISNKNFLHFFNSYVSNEIVNLKNNPKQYVLSNDLFNYKWMKILPIHYLKSYEELISQNIINSMNYAEYVLQSRFELGEPIIATNATHSFNYAFTILKSRFELGEPIIATSRINSSFYAQYVLDGKFELGESIMATEPNCAYEYARYVLKERFELGEAIIATDAYCACNYAIHVLNGRFELGELTIQHNPEFCAKYIEFLKIKYQINNQNKASSVLENIITSDRLL